MNVTVSKLLNKEENEYYWTLHAQAQADYPTSLPTA